ncbi:hypothetical protein TNCV_4060881 [Trichonephila clavipes]|nr:hypothetical protein TNCV_4060881 [Trichonephila clavipes]
MVSSTHPIVSLFISHDLFPHCCGYGNLVVKVTDSWVACQEFEPGVHEDPPCRDYRCTLNRSKLKRLLVGVVWMLGEEGVVLVT